VAVEGGWLGLCKRAVVEGGMSAGFFEEQVLADVDCGSDDLDSVMDSLVILQLQVTVSNDESIIEHENVNF
jgi:hypothetical protein